VPAPSKFPTSEAATICTRCGDRVVDVVATSAQCGATLSISDAETVDSSASSVTAGSAPPFPSSACPSSAVTVESSSSAQPHGLPSCTSNGVPDFGPRYCVERILGEGGMGTVYKAWDKELERTVALKLIRHDLTRDPSISQRFRQELLLASKISHRNVLRIHDLGDGPGDTKFISMACVEGQDLSQLLRKERKLPLERVLNIALQLCAALEAAHAEGVVHRDLKPQNILVDLQDHIYVSDFGLAKSLESDLGMTQTGQFLGTPRYMSPEQAEIGSVDHRSDLYAFGLILCELVTGHLPFEHAESTMQMMYQRVHETPKDPRQLNPDLPEYIARIIQKCLERDVTQRYQGAREILEDLNAGRSPTLTLRSRFCRAVAVFPGGEMKSLPASAILLLLILGLLAIPSIRGTLFPTSGIGKPDTVTPAVSLAIVPFRNASGDPNLDWLGPILAEVLTTDVGQSSSLRVVSSDRMRQISHDLRIVPAMPLDPPTLRRLSEFSNADVLVSGQYARFGEQLRIDASVRDLKRDRTAALSVEAQNEELVVAAVDRLAKAVRENLVLPVSAIKEMQERSLRPSTQSLPALRGYSQGVELARQGKNLEAVRQFSAATEADAQFALAYSKLAQVESSLGYDNEAEHLAQKAVDLSDNLPSAEKFLISAIHAQVVSDYPKAIASYKQLAKFLPDDSEVEFGLAGVCESAGSFDEARNYLKKVLGKDPKFVDALLASGRVEIKGGNSQVGLEFLTRGLALAIQLENNEEKAAILQAMGVAYRRLGKQDEALHHYQQSLEIRQVLGDKRGMAVSFNQIAQVQDEVGKSDEALKDYKEALRLRREIGDKKGVGDSLIDLGAFYHDRGHYDEALKFFKESLQIERELGDESNQSLCLNNIGSCYSYKGEYEEALTNFQQALQLREKANVPDDIVLTVHNLADNSARLGRYNQALTYYVRALDLNRTIGDQRGAALVSSNMGTLFGYQGRYGAALNAKKEALDTFRELKDRSAWLGEILSGYGLALADAGRIEEGQKSLDEAMDLARELKSDTLAAQVLGYKGDCFFYRDDFKSARTSYDRAYQLALRTSDKEQILLFRFGIAKTMLKQGHAREAAAMLKKLNAEADGLGLKFVSVKSSIYLAEALIQSKDYAGARQELERAALQAEKLELRILLAQDHYLMGTVERLSTNPAEAMLHYRNAVRLLDEAGKDVAGDTLLQRADLNRIYSESNKWSQGKGTS
jgi:eukaryotic-like serine/threonine-protein kinase